MNVLVTGSIAYDYLMRFPGKFTDHFIGDQLHQVSLSFLVEDMSKHWGGVAANIAYGLALLGLRPRLMGTVGKDFNDYRQWLESVGVDTSTVRQYDNVFTASFFANTDIVNNQIASFYSGAMAFAKEYSISDAYKGNPDLVIISPNDPEAMSSLTQECRERNIRFIYDPSQQVARFSGEELKRDVHGAYMMVSNAYEAEIICQKTEQSIEDLVRDIEIVVITQGERGSHIYHQGKRIEVMPFSPSRIMDPTGVGDAFRAGFIYGVINKWPLELAGQIGSLCATYVLEQVGTQNHKYTPEEFVTRFRTRYDDEGRLDRLLQQVSTK